jgi:hypothetical protein
MTRITLVPITALFGMLMSTDIADPTESHRALATKTFLETPDIEIRGTSDNVVKRSGM